jgi:hypothetical protein
MAAGMAQVVARGAPWVQLQYHQKEKDFYESHSLVINQL